MAAPDGSFGKSFKVANPLYKYIDDTTLRLTDVQKKLREETAKLPMAKMLSDGIEIQLLQNILISKGAKKVLDIGVFTGYSALSFALALPEDGSVVACDVSEAWASVGKPFWKEAGVADKIDLRIAPAKETLNTLLSKGEENTYDMSFIDADKENYKEYYELSLRLLKSGGLIVVDNALWSGKVMDPNEKDKETSAIRDLNDFIRTDQRVNPCLLTVGDGTMLAFKK